MDPSCHRCKKTVYPVEKLNCLDKYWHKECFNCETCKMTLTMKTYKGYKKLPYCNTHYPTTKVTAVADTPEHLRLSKNTTNQSAVVYHKEFEEEKGKFTAVSDDPETLGQKKTQQQASGLAYAESMIGQDQPSVTVKQTSTENPVPLQYQPPPKPPAPTVVRSSSGRTYVALYDYTGADDDEVNFKQGDVITNGEVIDEGWMTGTVKRTGKAGMLPSNYVEEQG